MQYSLKELRARLGYTQQNMADKLGISRQAYMNIEREPRKASCKRMMQIAEILNVNISDIFLQ